MVIIQSFIHSLIEHVVTESQLCASCYSRHQGCNFEEDRQEVCLADVHILEGRQVINTYVLVIGLISDRDEGFEGND